MKAKNFCCNKTDCIFATTMYDGSHACIYILYKKVPRPCKCEEGCTCYEKYDKNKYMYNFKQMIKQETMLKKIRKEYKNLYGEDYYDDDLRYL